MPPLDHDASIRRLIEECTNEGITKLEGLWMDQEVDQHFWVCPRRDWWEQRGPTEEVDRVEEALANRKIRKHTGEYKLRWDYKPHGIFSINEAYELFTEAEDQMTDLKWTK